MATVNTTETGCAKVFARQKRSQGKMKAENGIAHVLHVKLLSISLYCCCCTSNWSEKYCLQPSAQNMIVWAKKQNKRTTVSTPWFQAGWGKYYKSFLQHKGNDIEKKPIMMHIGNIFQYDHRSCLLCICICLCLPESNETYLCLWTYHLQIQFDSERP